MSEVVGGITGTLAFACSIILAVWAISSDVVPNWVRIIGLVYLLVMLFAFGFVLGGGSEE